MMNKISEHLKLWHPGYARFMNNDQEFRIGQRAWIIGVIMLLLFSPAFYFVFFEDTRWLSDPSIVLRAVGRWDFWATTLVLGAVVFLSLYLIGFYRMAIFQKYSGQFEYKTGFFIFPIKDIKDTLSNVRLVELETVLWRRKSEVYEHTKLLIHYKDRVLLLGMNLATPEDARRLAILIGCDLMFSLNRAGTKNIINTETVEEAIKKVEQSSESRKDRSVEIQIRGNADRERYIRENIVQVAVS